MSEWAAKRFWENAGFEARDGGWHVTLDGRGVKTPARAPLVLPTEALARAVADEWAAQGEVIDPSAMPYTRTANSALDKVAVQFDEVADYLAAYGETDLLCYRADAPANLTKRQADAWDPLLSWAHDSLGAQLNVASGVMPVAQDGETLSRLRSAVRDHSVFELAALHDLVALSGSLIIGLAASRRIEPPESLFAISRIDETFQEEQWGEDSEAAEAKEKKLADFVHAADFFRIAQKTISG